jgi:hypothetical protein
VAAIAIPSVRAMELFRLFDGLAAFGYSIVTLFDDLTPGAESALIAWAEAHGHVWKQDERGPTDARFVVTSVNLSRGGKLGALISVQAGRAA